MTGRSVPCILVSLVLFALLAAGAAAGGTGDRVVLLVDPTDAESLYLANVYRAAREVPARNILTMTPWTDGNYADLAVRNVPAFLDTLAARNLDDHVDQVLLMPTRKYRVSASGLISDPCSGVGNFAIASVYTMAYMKDELLAAQLSVWEMNRYASGTDSVVAFDGTKSWLSGSVSTSTNARRYIIGSMLGYTGLRGNTVADLVALVQRSAAADGTRPAGSFYLCETANDARSGPRHGLFPAVVSSITALGMSAEHLLAKVPTGKHDCLGVMTGYAAPSVVNPAFTVVPGAFCDHLTSFAGMFDATSQTKMSAWITQGASGTAGAVEEPCNYSGKFPSARVHLYYAQGLTLGEAYFRSAAYVPFQILLYGDPLTRAHAYIPTVTVPDAPNQSVSGTMTLSPQASTTHPTASIAGFDLHLDGVLIESVGPSGTFSLDTRDLDDGHHDLRILARDDSVARTIGAWIGSMVTSNRGHASTISSSPTSGNLGTAFAVTVGATGGTVEEIRILHHGRVVAASKTSPATLTIHGSMLGAGPAEIVTEALFDGGRRARSTPLTLDIAYSGGGTGGTTPVAFGYTKVIPLDATSVVELPATHRDTPDDATFAIVDQPTSATVLPGTAAGFRLITADADAEGEDTFTYRVTTSSGTSQTVTVTLVYGAVTIEPDPPSTTLALVTTRGDIKDKDTPLKDKLEARGTIEFLPASPDGTIDPSTEAVTVTVGGVEGAFSLTIPAGDPGWKLSDGSWRYRSPSGVKPKIRVKLKLASGKFVIKVSKATLVATPINPIRVSIEAGGDRGAHQAEWRIAKPGRFKLR